MHAVSQLPSCPSFLNSSYFDHHTFDCSITPVIGTGHGYVKIACEILGIKETLGFYPCSISTDLEQKQEEIMDQKFDPDNFPRWYLQLRQLFRYADVALQSSILAGLLSMPFPATLGGKYSGKNLAKGAGRGFSGLKISNAPFMAYDLHHKGTYKVPGKVVDDSKADWECSYFGSDTCKSVTIRATPNQVLKAIKYAETVHYMGQRAILTGQLDDASLKEGIYKVINNNCIDFVINLVNKAGKVQWIEHLKEPNFNFFALQSQQFQSKLKQITFLAWNYLCYTSWRDS